MEIKVLGMGCKKCKLLEKHAKKAVEALGIEATVEKVEDPAVFSDYNVMQTPALVVDGEVKVKGRVPSAKKLQKILAE